MSEGNIALAFGALLGGAVVIDYGVKNFKNGFSSSAGNGANSSPTSGTAPTGGALPKGDKGSTIGSFTPKTTSGVIAATPSAQGFSAARKQFANTLASDSGLDVNVILAWMANEQGWGAGDGNGTAPNGINNWLNIGSTDSGFYGGSNPAWTNPITAANETYYWLQGNPIVDYGAPSSGIRNILSTAGQSPDAQITAITTSGWASGGESILRSAYAKVTGR